MLLELGADDMKEILGSEGRREAAVQEALEVLRVLDARVDVLERDELALAALRVDDLDVGAGRRRRPAHLARGLGDAEEGSTDGPLERVPLLL